MVTIYTIHEGSEVFYGKSFNDVTLKASTGGQKMKEPWFRPGPGAGKVSDASFKLSREQRDLRADIEKGTISLLTRGQADLWIPRVDVIGNDGVAPPGLRMHLNDNYHYWELCALRREGDHGEAFDPVSAELFALGVLYKKVQAAPESFESIEVNITPIKKGNVRINPLVLEFSVKRGHANSSNAPRISPATVRTWLIERPLLDLHIVADEADLPRLKLQALIWNRWKHCAERPVLPRLLLGEAFQPGSPPLPACFPLLDLMGGTFFVDDFAAAAPTRWRWLPGSAFDDRADLRWLAELSAKRLGLDVITVDEAPKSGAFERDQREYNEQTLEAIAIGANQEHENGAAIWQHMPRLLREVKASKMGNEIQEQVEENVDSQSGFRRFRFIEETGRRHLLPLSPILVQLPAAPGVLAEADRQEWERVRAVVRLDPRIKPVAAAAWWLGFLDEGPADAPSESETWSLWANSGLPFWSWWWSWYAAMFRKSPDWQPTWEAPAAAGRIGKAELGTLRLGAKGTIGRRLDVGLCLSVKLTTEGP